MTRPCLCCLRLQRRALPQQFPCTTVCLTICSGWSRSARMLICFVESALLPDIAVYAPRCADWLKMLLCCSGRACPMGSALGRRGRMCRELAATRQLRTLRWVAPCCAVSCVPCYWHNRLQVVSWAVRCLLLLHWLRSWYARKCAGGGHQAALGFCSKCRPCCPSSEASSLWPSTLSCGCFRYVARCSLWLAQPKLALRLSPAPVLLFRLVRHALLRLHRPMWTCCVTSL